MPDDLSHSSQTDAASSSRRLIACAVVAVAAHAPLVVVHLMHLWTRPHYRFVFVLLGITIWLLRKRWPHGEPYLPARHLERLLLCSSVLLLTGGIWINSPLLAAISAILVTGFFILHAAGLRAIPALLGVWCLLWLAVPPPLGYDVAIIARMQALTSTTTSMMLDFIGLPHLMTGNVLQVSDRTFFVDEACSGVHSLFALIGYTAVFVVMTSRTLVRSLVLLASSFVWAILLNLVRITTIAAASVWWSLDLSTGWPHEILGLVAFLLALSLTLSTDQWLSFVGFWTVRLSRWLSRQLGRTTSRRPRLSVSLARQHQMVRQREQALSGVCRPSRIRSLVAMSAYCLLLLANVSMRPDQGLSVGTKSPITEIDVSFLPETTNAGTVTDFQRVKRNFSSDFGSTSLTWTIASPDGQAVFVSLDSSFSGWHELTRCYQGYGWAIVSRNVMHQGGLSWVEAALSKPTGEHAYLAFSLATPDGRPLTPVTDAGTLLLDRLRESPAIQIQAFAESHRPFEDSLRERVRGAFQTAMSRWCASRTTVPNTSQSNKGDRRG